MSKFEVSAFWEAEACGERYGERQDRLRYELEPEILAFAGFDSAAGLRVLEIGVGMGSDFLRWLKGGASATGVDLTERALRITRERARQAGATPGLQIADAEALPFGEATFDVVYSWGVLHHTPDTGRAVAEARRVLKPGGRLKVMMYQRRSWVALAAWVRFGVMRGRPWTGMAEAVAHIESPGTKAFTVAEGRRMLAGMDEVSVRPCLTHWDRKYALGIARLLGDRFGWFLLMEARKPGR